jgi:hydroxyacylglutathione hydrolase
MNVFVIPLLDDNFCYYVYKEDIQNGFFVDVGEFDGVLDFLKDKDIKHPTHILSTHKHWDHSGGNEMMRELFGTIEIIGGKDD